jgi:hypothetical protein
MANSRLAAQRAEVLRLQRNAGKKISRIKSQGVVVAGTEFDVRKDRKLIAGYNEKQLAALAARLTSFNSRTMQFVPDREARPVPRTEWKKFKAAEQFLNTKKARELASVADMKMPIGDSTVGQRTAQMTADHAWAGNPAVNPFRPSNKLPTDIVSRRALKKLTKNLQKRQNAKYDDKEHRQNRKIYKKMFDDAGASDLAKRINKLTPKQFMFMWHYTGFVEAAKKKYVLKQLMGHMEVARHESVLHDAFTDMEKFVEWAEGIR